MSLCHLFNVSSKVKNKWSSETDSSTAFYGSTPRTYVVCQKCRARTGAGPKKIRDRSGPDLDRPSPEPGTGPVLTLVKGQGHKVQNHIEGDRVTGMSYALY